MTADLAPGGDAAELHGQCIFTGAGEPSRAGGTDAFPTAPVPVVDLGRLRETLRSRLVRNTDLYTVLVSRLAADAPVLPVALVDELVALTAAILQHGGDTPGDRVLAAFALYQRSRLGGSGAWDDDPRAADRHLLAAADGLTASTGGLLAVAFALAGALDDRYPDGAVRAHLAGRFAPVQKALDAAGVQALAVPRPGGLTLLAEGRLHPVAFGTPLPRRLVVVPDRRPLPALPTLLSYATTPAQLIDLAGRARPALGSCPVFHADPAGPAAALHDAFYRVAPRAPTSPTLLYLGADGFTGRSPGGLAVLAPGRDPFADDLLDAGFTGVIGWRRPVPGPVALAATVVLHRELLADADPEPAVVLRRIQSWMRVPGGASAEAAGALVLHGL
ncbi:hypothetical protein [Actinoplanes rectilineatus]|uniref:hypothetical protein n=1 Tax=Actinoplanes rectilineatus TaxID=113571 RepID=UPI0005F2CB41|nr:hypothetical protein [Actinoplanes rectilineatus]